MVAVRTVGVGTELGMLLLGLAVLRAAVLPAPWRVLPLVIFLLNILFSYFLGRLFLAAEIDLLILMVAQEVLLGLGWALMGYSLWSGMGEGARRPIFVR